MAERTRGMGRGLAAILSSTAERDAERDPELRELPVDLIGPNPHQPRQRFDEASLVALADSLRGARRAAAGARPPAPRRHLRADRRRAPLARRAARGLRHDPRARAPARRRRVARARADREHGPRGPHAGRGGARLRRCSSRSSASRARRSAGASAARRVAVSNLLRLLDLPDEALELLEDGELTEGHGRALLLAPGHDDRRRLARAAAADGWTVRETEARARAADARPAPWRPAAARGERPAHPDQAEAADRLAEALARTLGTDVRVTPRGNGFRVALEFDSLEDAMALADASGRRSNRA